MCKDIWNVDCGIWRGLLWAEHKFSCGITGLRKAEKIDVNDATRPGRPSTTDEENYLNNRRTTIRDIADDVGLSFGSCQTIFTDVLGMKRAAGNIITKLLNFEHH